MKILILSCTTGEGHNSAAKALKFYFDQNGDECYMADAIAFRSETISKIVAEGHVFIYTKTPKIFDIVYNGAEIFAKKETSRHDSVIFKLLAKGADKLYEYIVEHNFDRIVCFHPFAAQMLTKVFRDHPDLRQIPSYLIATDYTASPGAGESKVDVYITPHRDVEHEFVRRGVPKAKIIPVGIPINPAYTSLPTREQARDMLELSQDDRVVILMSGSMGCGPIAKIAGMLTAQMSGDTTLVIICGRNEKLYKDLTPMASKNEKVRLLGFTDKLPMYMSAADLMLSKPGGLSSTEAACARLPMVIIDAVAGCETYNLNFFVNNGFSVTANTPEGIVRETLALLYDDERLSAIREKLRENFSSDTAYRIYDIVREGRGND